MGSSGLFDKYTYGTPTLTTAPSVVYDEAGVSHGNSLSFPTVMNNQNNAYFGPNFQFALSIPEPSTWSLCGVAGLSVLFVSRRVARSGFWNSDFTRRSESPLSLLANVAPVFPTEGPSSAAPQARTKGSLLFPTFSRSALLAALLSSSSRQAVGSIPLPVPLRLRIEPIRRWPGIMIGNWIPSVRNHHRFATSGKPTLGNLRISHRLTERHACDRVTSGLSRGRGRSPHPKPPHP